MQGGALWAFGGQTSSVVLYEGVEKHAAEDVHAVKDVQITTKQWSSPRVRDTVARGSACGGFRPPLATKL